MLYNMFSWQFDDIPKPDLKEFPLVSYVIPVYNVYHYLLPCLKSIKKQDYPNIQIIVVDDGSTNRSVRYAIDSYKAMYNDIIAVNKEHKGVGAALNAGFELATGKYICFFAADDVIVARIKTSAQVSVMEKTQADISYFLNMYHGMSTSCAKLVEPKFTPSFVPGFKFLNYIIPKNNWLLHKALLIKEPINSGSLMIRRSAYEKYGPWNENVLTTDYEFLLRYAKLGAKFQPIPGAPIFYRNHRDQCSKQYDKMKTDANKTKEMSK
jgi:glycosyltransferase involved in cell wall biosynthesis